MKHRAINFTDAKRQYVNRYTMEHVPQWAKAPHFHTERRACVYYAPHFATDREWYDATRFPGEEGWFGMGSDCYTANHTWPLGKGFLAEPFHMNRNQRAA